MSISSSISLPVHYVMAGIVFNKIVGGGIWIVNQLGLVSWRGFMTLSANRFCSLKDYITTSRIKRKNIDRYKERN